MDLFLSDNKRRPWSMPADKRESNWTHQSFRHCGWWPLLLKWCHTLYAVRVFILALARDHRGYKFRSPIINPRFIYRNFPYRRSLRSKTAAFLPTESRGPKEQTLSKFYSWQGLSRGRNVQGKREPCWNQAPGTAGILKVCASQDWSTSVTSPCSIQSTLVAWNFKNVLMC